VPAEQHTLAAASIAGLEFSAAEIEWQCAHLAEWQQVLRRVGVAEWPDGTRAARYRFVHALYHQLWQERGSPTQRQHYHRHTVEHRLGWGRCLLYAGGLVSVHATCGNRLPLKPRHDPPAAAPALPSSSVIVFGNRTLRSLNRRFTCVHPARFSLAWVMLRTNITLGG
jgi:hypothetical protein